MQPGLLIRLRPLGAWRYGPADGGQDRVDTLYRSDRLYSAVTLAMQRLGVLDEWLAVTARSAQPAVVFSSLFPFQAETLFVAPPATVWPPPANLLTSPSPIFSTKIRWKTARFVPVSVIDSLVTGQPILADQWLPDPESGCLLRRDRPSWSPFRTVMRSSAAVDRISLTGSEVNSFACVEFEPGAGLWTVARFHDAEQEKAWSGQLQAALRLLADSGFGGGRSKGWGQMHPPEFQSGTWPGLLLPKLGRFLRNAPAAAPTDGSNSAYWLLSLYSPSTTDRVDWSGGHYSLAQRCGRVESSAGSGALKKVVRMVNEGCVVSASEEPIGAAVDVAPDGFAHPVYRSGLALALRLPVVEIHAIEERAVEEPSTAEAVVEELPAAEPVQHDEPLPFAAAAPEPEPETEPPPVQEPPTPEHPVTEPPLEEPKTEEEPPHEL